MADANQPTPGEWAIIGGGAVALIGSFLEFAIDESAWGSGFFPIVTLIPIYLVVIAVQVSAPKSYMPPTELAAPVVVRPPHTTSLLPVQTATVFPETFGAPVPAFRAVFAVHVSLAGLYANPVLLLSPEDVPP